MPPHLNPLLAAVIVLAIAHAVIKVRARAAAGRMPRRPSARPMRAPTGGRGSPDAALAALREAVEEHT